MTARPGRKAIVKVGGTPTTLTNAGTTANVARTQYTITDATKRVLSPTVAMTVQTSPDGTTWSAASGYSINRLRGIVTFASARPVGTQIRVSGTYIPMATIALCHDFSYSLSADNADITCFGDTYNRRAQVSRDISGNLATFEFQSHLFNTALNNETVVTIEFFSLGATDTIPDFVCWALLAKADIAAAPDGIADQTVDFEGTLDADDRALAFGS